MIAGQKKRSIGVLLFGSFFIFLGIMQLKFPLTLFWLPNSDQVIGQYQEMYTTVMAATEKYDTYLTGKELNESEKTVLQWENNALKQSLVQFKADHLDKRFFPFSAKVLILFSLISSLAYIYTGISMIKLNPSITRYLFFSVFSGLCVGIIFAWWVVDGTSFPMFVQDKVEIILAQIKHAPSPQPHSMLDIAKVMFMRPFIALVAILQLIFIALIIFFFSRPKVKAQFKTGLL
jgi:hypothetical protein